MAKLADARRTRRKVSGDFRSSVVRQDLVEGRTGGTVVRELELKAIAVGLWLGQGRTERTNP